jgi:nicotinamidase-related amidase
VPSLTPQSNELVINKTTYGTFTSTGLDRALRNMGIHTLVVQRHKFDA